MAAGDLMVTADNEDITHDSDQCIWRRRILFVRSPYGHREPAGALRQPLRLSRLPGAGATAAILDPAQVNAFYRANVSRRTPRARASSTCT